MKKFVKNNALLFFGLAFILIFFHKVIIYGLLPIPTDNIVGLYHPYRDFYSAQYPRGIPFSNMLVTDPVRQQYVWRELAVSIIKEGHLPLWNSYSFSGYPLLANFQSAVFYPLNFVLFVLPFQYGWTALIMSQLFLAFVFMYLYLSNLKLSKTASFIGAIAFSFSGFSVAWLEWGNIVSTGLWLPLVLLSIDKILRVMNHESRIMNKKLLIWFGILLFTSISSFLAGHLQTFFYLSIVSLAYLIFRWFENGKNLRILLLFVITFFVFVFLTAIQWIPTLQFVLSSARELDQVSTSIEGWFVPWQNLVQFIAPDFFGNPATLNYWGIWNYGEFIGYVGIFPLILALGALFIKKDKRVLFFGLTLLVGLVFSFPNFISKIPFYFEIPFISTTQPTRLIYIVDFSLAVLAAMGFDYFVKNKKRILIPGLFVGIVLCLLWLFVFFNSYLSELLKLSPENLSVTLNNLKLPSLLFTATFGLIILNIFGATVIKNKKYPQVITILIILVFLFDVFRFAGKYTVFSKSEYLYPTTKALDYLKKDNDLFRVMEADSRILPPNFTNYYKIQSVDGYDPLYLRRYAELVAAVGRGKPDIRPPFGFNRIITPQNYSEDVLNIFNVKYLLALVELENDRFEKVFEEGETKIYQNNNFIERAFFVDRTQGANNKQTAIEKIFENKTDLSNVAVVEGKTYEKFNREWSRGKVEVVSYNPNKIIMKVENQGKGFLVLSDSYYPTWKASIDGVPVEILITNYNFRGIVVPGGSKEVIFTNHIF